MNEFDANKKEDLDWLVEVFSQLDSKEQLRIIKAVTKRQKEIGQETIDNIMKYLTPSPRR